MGPGHGHDHGVGGTRAGVRHRRRLLISFVLIGSFFVVEAVAGILANSLALLSDAGHMLTDVLGLGMALAAVQLAERAARRREAGALGRHTFGLYRMEILAAFINALLLFGVAVYVVIEGVLRLTDQPDVDGVPMLVVAILGLLVNLVAFALLRPGAGESLNIQGAYLEVLADTLGSIGVIVAAVLVEVFGWQWADPLFGAAIGVFIVPRTWRLGRQAARVLLQVAPPHLDPAEIQLALAALPGVVDVHDLHVWTLTSEMESASVHLMVAVDADTHGVLDRARHLLRDRYEIAHATLQVEPEDHRGCDLVEW